MATKFAMLARLISQTRFIKNVVTFIRPASMRCRQTFGYIISLFDQFRVCSIGNHKKHLRRHFTLRSFKHVKTSISNSQNKQSALFLAGRVADFLFAM